MKTALYRHFDASGALLYVGISLSAVARLAQHRRQAGWFNNIARVDVEWVADRPSALAAESAAIRAEQPIWNVRGKRIATPKRVSVQADVENRASRVFTTSLNWCIHHRVSGRSDGWYSGAQVAQHMLGWYRVVFPLDNFELFSLNGPLPALGKPALRPMEHRSWARTSEPQYGAGDAFDMHSVEVAP